MKQKNGATMIVLFVLKRKSGVDGLLLFAFINGANLESARNGEYGVLGFWILNVEHTDTLGLTRLFTTLRKNVGRSND